MKNKYLFILVVIFLITIIPYYIVRDYTPKNELKYLYITQELQAGNNLFVLTEDGEMYTDKPPFYFWLLHFSEKISSPASLLALGIWTWISALLLLIIQYYYSSRYIDRYAAFLGCLLLLTTVCFTVGTLSIRMDMLQTFFIFMSLLQFFNIYSGASSKSLLIWIYMALAVWIKGPAGILIPTVVMFTFLIVEKKTQLIRSIKPFRGLCIILLFMLIWLVPAYFEGGKDYINAILFKQTLGRGFDAFIHKEPFYYYFKTSVIYFAPWVFFYFSAVVYTLFNYKKSNSFQRFLSVWILSTFITFSLFSSKISIYLLPIYPAMAMLVSSFIFKDFKYKRYFFKGFVLLLSFSTIFISLLMPSKINGIDFLINKWFLSISYSLLALLVILFFKRYKILCFIMLVFPLMLIIQGSFVISKMNSILGMQELNSIIKKELKSSPRCNVFSYKYKEGKYLKAYSGVNVRCIEEKIELIGIINNYSRSLVFTKEKYKNHLDNLGGNILYSNSRYTLIKYDNN